MTKKLKPCPWCKKADKIFVVYPDVYAMCGNCGARGPVAAHGCTGITLWNRRPEMGATARTPDHLRNEGKSAAEVLADAGKHNAPEGRPLNNVEE